MAALAHLGSSSDILGSLTVMTAKAEKGIFGITRQIQSQNVDVLVCHTTVAFTRYIVLEWIRRTSTDEQSFGELFRYLFKDVEEAPIKEVLLNLMKLCFDMFEELK